PFTALTSVTTLPPHPCSPLFPYTTLFRSLTGRRLQALTLHRVRRVARAPQRQVAVDPALGRDRERGRARQLRVIEPLTRRPSRGDRKSTRLNSSHVKISYAVFCLKKKNNN